MYTKAKNRDGIKKKGKKERLQDNYMKLKLKNLKKIKKLKQI